MPRGYPSFREAEPAGPPGRVAAARFTNDGEAPRRQPRSRPPAGSQESCGRVITVPSRDRRRQGPARPPRMRDSPLMTAQATARSGREQPESGGRNHRIAGQGLTAAPAGKRLWSPAWSGKPCLQEIATQLMGRGEIAPDGEPDEEQRGQCCRCRQSKDDHHLVLDRQQGRRTGEDLARHHPR